MKILVTSRLPREIMSMIEKWHDVESNDEDGPMERERLLEGVSDKQGLLCTITDKVDEVLLEKAPDLKMIANYGVGFDNIDLDAATKRDIPVSNTPDVLTPATADITLALILAVARRVVEGDRRTRTGRFRSWSPMLFLGREVSGKTLGIIGMGRIGKAVARRARGFDMQILYHNRTRLGAEGERTLGVKYVNRNTLLSDSDFVSLHIPLGDETRHFIGAEELGLMKPGAYLINTSRGPVVDEKALLDALLNKEIAGAGLDVYENEPEVTPGLKNLDNVVLLPHVGSATLETRTKMAQLAAENLLAGLKGEVPPNCLNCEFVSRVR